MNSGVPTKQVFEELSRRPWLAVLRGKFSWRQGIYNFVYGYHSRYIGALGRLGAHAPVSWTTSPGPG